MQARKNMIAMQAPRNMIAMQAPINMIAMQAPIKHDSNASTQKHDSNASTQKHDSNASTHKHDSNASTQKTKKKKKNAARWARTFVGERPMVDTSQKSKITKTKDSRPSRGLPPPLGQPSQILPNPFAPRSPPPAPHPSPPDPRPRSPVSRPVSPSWWDVVPLRGAATDHRSGYGHQCPLGAGHRELGDDWGLTAWSRVVA
jgi:hypothetical protein